MSAATSARGGSGPDTSGDSAGYVTRGEDAWHAGPETLVHEDPVVHGKASRLGQLNLRRDPNADHHDARRHLRTVQEPDRFDRLGAEDGIDATPKCSCTP